MFYCFFLYTRLSVFLVYFSFGTTINLTAFFEVLLWRGLLANTWNNSSLLTKWVSFYRILIDSVSKRPISSEKSPSWFFWEAGTDVLLLIKARISTFVCFLSSFRAIYCFFILLMYLLVEAKSGISPESLSTCSLIFTDFNFFSWGVPAYMIILLD